VCTAGPVLAGAARHSVATGIAALWRAARTQQRHVPTPRVALLHGASCYPRDSGLGGDANAVATIVMVGLAMFSDLGLRQSIVQSRRGDEPAFLNTAWALQILRGVVLWAIAVAASAWSLAGYAVSQVIRFGSNLVNRERNFCFPPLSTYFC
jgi:hypothetical protein